MGWPAADGGGKRKRAVLGSLSSWSRSGIRMHDYFHGPEMDTCARELV